MILLLFNRMWFGYIMLIMIKNKLIRFIIINLLMIIKCV